ncbi:MAG: histone deacetylase [Chloroflexota bacterium]|nr:histone deacetylase [Chloroflexota bacterium]
MNDLKTLTRTKVGIVYDSIYLRHDTGQHVENAQRLTTIMDLLHSTGIMQQVTSIMPIPASIDDLLTTHSADHIYRVEQLSQKNGVWLDSDTVVSASSYEAALYAAGGLIKSVDLVLNGELSSAFAMVRPPGHHAAHNAAMGFCLFNNIAIAAHHSLKSLDRVLIVDFDVHHGNGTQDAFYDNPNVLYFSTHQFPYYPGTGDFDEIGQGIGQGTTINVPLPAGCGDREYLAVYNDILVPAARRFKPQLIMISAGYDPHLADPLASMHVTTPGFASIVCLLRGIAEEMCAGKIVLTLEGGYDPSALAESVKATVEVLLEDTVNEPSTPPPTRGTTRNIDSIIGTVRKVHNLG